MTATSIDNYLTLDLQQEQDDYSINVISSNTFSADSKKVLSHTTMAIKSLANSYYKASPFLEVSDIEQIKNSLNNYANNDKKVSEFKNALIKDLTNFQAQIKTSHIQKLAELGKEKQFCEKQVKVLDFAKHKLIMDRLAKVEWPYDSKTKEYEGKIAALQIKIQKYEQKIDELGKKRPSANEKDILIYQMQLKEKFAI